MVDNEEIYAEQGSAAQNPENKDTALTQTAVENADVHDTPNSKMADNPLVTDDSQDVLAYIEQTNQSENANSQENIFNLHLNDSGKPLTVNLNSRNTDDELQLIFNEFINKNYAKGCETELAYIDNLIHHFFQSFIDTRIAVINSIVEEETISRAAIEALITKGRAYDGFLFSCCIDQPDIDLNYLVKHYKKNTKRIIEKKGPGEGIIVISFDKHHTAASSKLLKNVLNKDSFAIDSVFGLLEKEKLKLVFSCIGKELYKEITRENAHFALLHVSSLHLNVYKAIQDQNSYLEMIPLVEKALNKYEWLSTLSSEEKEKRIIELVLTCKLESELTDNITNIDLEENKASGDLLKDPLNSILLFVAGFFNDLAVDEFDNIVRLLLLCPLRSKNLMNEQVASWEMNGDGCLSGCGIAVQQTASEALAFQFASLSRQSNTRKIFLANYKLQLLRNIDAINKAFTIPDQSFSKKFIEQFVELISTLAKIIQEEKIISLYHGITAELSNPIWSEKQLRILFNRLIYFVVQCEEGGNFTEIFKVLYRQMATAPFERGILGAILTHITIPGKPQHIDTLKLLLNSIADDEYFIKLKIPRIIFSNYIDNLDELVTPVNQWMEVSGDKPVLQRAFSFFKSSLYFLFYEKRFSHIDEKGLDYSIVQYTVINEKHTNLLFSFFFSNKNSEMLDAFFEKEMKNTGWGKKFDDKLRKESFYSLYAFLFIRWYCLLNAIAGKDMLDPAVLKEKINELIRFVKTEMPVLLLLSSLTKSIRKYNTMIQAERNSGNGDINKRNIYVNSRDATRALIKLLETNN